MERLIKERERLQRDIERLHRKQSKAVVDAEVMSSYSCWCYENNNVPTDLFQDASSKQRLKEEAESLQENMDFINEQIQECQLEIMQV